MNFHLVKEMDEVLAVALAGKVKEKSKEKPLDKTRGKDELKYLPGPEPPQMYA